ncbi:CLUMA_CG012391, isoform A [Clunio marinus]|uniref:CLUMA_CG012391, isoform A n=1 Tax=Clunio marinus TaxID=568069 RepID=A0A1J1IG47_9DIPT|nr:CLUMA_CG012391, isoform A [Clunio marinus]
MELRNYGGNEGNRWWGNRGFEKQTRFERAQSKASKTITFHTFPLKMKAQLTKGSDFCQFCDEKPHTNVIETASQHNKLFIHTIEHKVEMICVIHETFKKRVKVENMCTLE